MIDSITGIILAGGRSKRMGKDKAFLLFPDKPLIEIIIDKISALFKDLIIVTNQPNIYKRYGLRVQRDILEDCGPLGGIYTGLLSSNSRYNFIVGCDMPFINPHLIRYMLQEINGSDVVIPKYNGGLETLCAVYSKTCVRPIEKELSGNNLKITDFFLHVKVRTISQKEVVQFDSRGLSFININTPQEYQTAARLRQ